MLNVKLDIELLTPLRAGEKFKTLRKSKKLNYVKVAKDVKINVGSVQNIEWGFLDYNMEQFQALCKYWGYEVRVVKKEFLENEEKVSNK